MTLHPLISYSTATFLVPGAILLTERRNPGPAPYLAAVETDETTIENEVRAATGLRLHAAKARSVAKQYPDALIIGSDQLAECAGAAIGKPGTHERAVAQLTRLSGRTVLFRTGLALLDATSGRCQTALVDVRSTFRFLSAAQIEANLRREQPYDS